MKQETIIEIFKDTGVMLQGHFQLTSGLHSDHYFQCARLFEHPHHSALLCASLAKQFEKNRIDLVVGPALGGIIMAYEVARALGVRNIFAERENGVMTFRRGFSVSQGERVLVVEDVVTTGGSVKEVIALLKGMGAEVVGVGCILNRSGGKVQFDCLFESLIDMEAKAYKAEECPGCQKGLPLVKPGSRTVKQSPSFEL